MPIHNDDENSKIDSGSASDLELETAAKIRGRIDALVDKVGHAVMGILGESAEEAFSYTVGLAHRGWPELIITGLSPQHAQMILNAAVSKLAHDGVIPTAGIDIIEAVNVPLRVGEVAAHHHHEHLRLANDRALRLGGVEMQANGSVAGLQIIWPDPSGRYPGDPGYNRLNFPQKLLNG